MLTIPRLQKDMREKLLTQEWLREHDVAGVVTIVFCFTDDTQIAGVMNCAAYQGVKGQELLEPARNQIVKALEQLNGIKP